VETLFLLTKTTVIVKILIVWPGNTEGGSITVQLTSFLTGLD
jgi:hypothetical protein